MSRALTLVAILFCIGAGLPAHSRVTGLWIWKPGNNGVRFVLPKLEGVHPDVFAENLQSQIRQSPVYGGMEGAKDLRLSTAARTFSDIQEMKPTDIKIEVVLNRPRQMTNKSMYLPRVIRIFERGGVHMLAVPVGLETVLSDWDLLAFRKLLNGFRGQLGVGGDDPHPAFYNQTDTSLTQGDISAVRDHYQAQYMLEYMINGRGRAYYICGSMQRVGIVLGFGFHADIGCLTEDSQKGKKLPVMREVLVDPNSELFLATGGMHRILTTNSHHASLDPKTGRIISTPLRPRITAYNIEPDGTRGQIVKAIDLPLNAGFATQFHFDLCNEYGCSQAEERMVEYILTSWKMGGRYYPEEIARCVGRRIRQLN